MNTKKRKNRITKKHGGMFRAHVTRKIPAKLSRVLSGIDSDKFKLPIESYSKPHSNSRSKPPKPHSNSRSKPHSKWLDEKISRPETFLLKNDLKLFKILSNGTIEIDTIKPTKSLYVIPRTLDEINLERKINKMYETLLDETSLTLNQKESVMNLKEKRSWVGWLGIEKTYNNTIQKFNRSIEKITVENVTTTALDTLYFGVRTTVLTTVWAYNTLTPPIVHSAIKYVAPTSLRGSSIQGHIILRAIDSGSFSSIIGLTTSCSNTFVITDWNDKNNLTKFYDDIIRTVVPILPVLFEDITNEGCKTIIPSVIRHVVAENTLANIALDKGIRALEKTQIGSQLIENVTTFGNVVVPLILQHMKENGIRCSGNLNDEAVGIDCFGEAGYFQAKSFFNNSLKLIVDSMSYCLKEQGKELFSAFIENDHPDLPRFVSEEDKLALINDFNDFIQSKDLNNSLLDRITKIYLSNVANDIKEVHDTAVEQLNREMEIRKRQGLLMDLASIDLEFDEFNLVQPRARDNINIYTKAVDGKISISKITTKFNKDELLRLIYKWGRNINTKLGEDKPYSTTECLLEAIDLRFPHILSEIFGVRNENLLEFADMASNMPLREGNIINNIIEEVIEEFIKPIAITMCIEKYIQPENYGKLKIDSLFTFFFIQPSSQYKSLEEID